MTITRRTALGGLAAATLTGCVTTGGSAPSRGPSIRAVPNDGWSAWVEGYKARARGRGLSPSVIDAAFREAGYLPGVIERDRNQTEFTRTFEDYLAIAASDERVSKGRSNARAQSGTLARIEQAYGVPAEVVAAIWGLESFYGERRGDIPVVSATSTLAYDGRRGEFFESQLTAALRILQSGDTTPGRMVGSWAGAMGHTQFIPTSYLAYAVDFTGDGRRDIWSDDPTDALASAAAYLAESGWRRGQPWGLEVRLPPGFAGPFGRGSTRSVAAWRAAGVAPARGGALPEGGAASIVAPSGASGPAFMVFRNFSVILRYNNAENYALGIGHLSDRIAGAGPITASFPPDRFGLTIDDRKALQRGLTRAGFDAGTPDGVLGPQTEGAIRAYQRANGLPETGTPSRALLARLG
ncbi:MAG: lytic murein transglycosylase [Paracoccaceae bacterium]|jgi:lytic murein transglycosylase|nr:lytic murein transglycosylase [Paracoccaceae bacterium]